jgi:probable phosphoglycerate mutase
MSGLHEAAADEPHGAGAAWRPDMSGMSGEPTRVIAIRHGETAWNVEARLQGQIDIPLNERGQAQALRAARSLADEKPDVVVTSDLSRAHATASVIATLNACPLILEPGLRERSFGSFEGLTHSEVAQRWPEQSQRWRSRDPDFAPGDGESLRVFFDRCIAATLRVVEAHAGKTIILVAHGGVLDCLYRAATRVDLDAPRIWQLDNAAINRMLHTDSGLTLVGWNDTCHLDDAALDEL